MIFKIDKESNLTGKRKAKGYAKYLVDRDPDSYTIIEGTQESFETSEMYSRETLKNDKPYYRIVLGFDEENLTQTEMIEIYNDWKKLYFNAYDEEEYELFSVIHWDDDKPHIHVGLISHNLINDKELRIYRGNMDHKRNDAVQELINNKYNLKSPYDSISLFERTKEQKNRDRKAKKNDVYTQVEDDKHQKNFENFIHQSNNFKEFKELILKEYPETIFHDQKSRLGKCTIKIDDKHKFTSALFNESWFNKNLAYLKKQKNLLNFNYKTPRKSNDEYQDIFEDKNFALKLQHREKSRNTHQGVVEYKLKQTQLLEELKIPYGIDTESIHIETLNALKKISNDSIENPEVTLELQEALLLNKKETVASLNKLKDNSDQEIETPTMEDVKAIPIESVVQELLNETLKNTQTKEEIDIILSLTNGSATKTDPNNPFIAIGDFILPIKDEKVLNALFTTNQILQEQLIRKNNSLSLFEKIENFSPRKRSELNSIKKEILNAIQEKNFTTGDSLYNFLTENQITPLKTGEDYKKGKYVTVEFNKKKFSIFSNHLHDELKEILEKKEIFPPKKENVISPKTQPSSVEIKKSQSDDNFNTPFPTSNDVLSSGVKEINFGVLKPESINEYKLKNSYEMDYEIQNTNADHFIDSTPLRDRKSKHSFVDMKNKIKLEKSLDPLDAIDKLIEELKQKNWKEISLGGDEFFNENVIENLKEKSKNKNSWIDDMLIIPSSNNNSIRLNNGKIIQVTNTHVAPKERTQKQEEINNEEYINHLEECIEITELSEEKKKILNNISNQIEKLEYSQNKNPKDYQKLLKEVAKLDDIEFFNQILEQLNLKVQIATKSKRSKKEFALVTNLNNDEEKLFFNDEGVIKLCKKSLEDEKEKVKQANINLIKSGYYDSCQSFDGIERKKKVLMKLYNKTFEKTPLLNYEIKDLNHSSGTNRVVSYYQKDSIIIDNNGTIEIKKSKDLEKTALAVAHIANLNNYKNIKINGSAHFQNLVNLKLSTLNTEEAIK